MQLDLPSERAVAQRVEQRLQRDALAVEQQLILTSQDPHLGEHVALGVEQRGVSAAADRDRGDVLREQRIEERHRFLAAQRELSAIGVINPAGRLGRRPVIRRVHLDGARHTFTILP